MSISYYAWNMSKSVCAVVVVWLWWCGGGGVVVVVWLWWCGGGDVGVGVRGGYNSILFGRYYFCEQCVIIFLSLHYKS